MVIKKEYIPLFRGIDMSQRRLPVIGVDSGHPGPTVFLTAAIHGDEVTGTAVILSLIQKLKSESLAAGRIHAFPILNPGGFETISRHEVYEEEDLNRFFDSSHTGSTSSILASIILESIIREKPDYVIDFHTDSLNSIAYTIIDFPKKPVAPDVLKRTIGLAEGMGFRWAIDTEENAGYPLEKCLTGQLLTRGIPAITVELGGPLFVHEPFRRMGLDSAWNLLGRLGMLASTAPPLRNAFPETAQYFEERVQTQSTGLVDYRIKPGTVVESGQTLAKIRNAFGETVEVIRAPNRAFVLSHEDQSICFPGQALFTIAVEKPFTYPV